MAFVKIYMKCGSLLILKLSISLFGTLFVKFIQKIAGLHLVYSNYCWKMTEKFCLKWNDFQSNFTRSFRRLRNEDDFCDVSLVSDDKIQVSAHRVVLSACSDYFKSILKQNKHQYPLLCLEGIDSNEMKYVLDYIYYGEIQIHQENLDRFLRIAQRLQIEGLTTEEEPSQVHKLDFEVEENDILETKTQSVASTTRSQELKPHRKFESSQNIIALNGSNFTNKVEIDAKLEELFERQSDGNFCCTTCGKVSIRRSFALEHAETHVQGLEYPCQTCDKVFRSRGSIRKHVCCKI